MTDSFRLFIVRADVHCILTVFVSQIYFLPCPLPTVCSRFRVVTRSLQRFHSLRPIGPAPSGPQFNCCILRLQGGVTNIRLDISWKAVRIRCSNVLGVFLYVARKFLWGWNVWTPSRLRSLIERQTESKIGYYQSAQFLMRYWIAGRYQSTHFKNPRLSSSKLHPDPDGESALGTQTVWYLGSLTIFPIAWTCEGGVGERKKSVYS